MKKHLLTTFIVSVCMFASLTINAQSSGGNIFFVTSAGVTNLQTKTQGDSLTIDFLIKQGYTITRAYPTDADWNFEKLNKADVVIIGRAIASADFAGKDSLWATVKTPVMIMSQYAAQAKKLKMFKVDAVITDTTFVGTMKAKVIAPDDTVFDNIVLANGDTIEYSTGSYTTIKFGADSFATQNNGKVLIQTKITGFSGSKAASGADAIIMARWAAGVETYPGSKVKPASTWSYFGMGDDQKKIGGVTKITNFFQFTEASKQLFINEINYLKSINPKNSIGNVTFVTSAGVINLQTKTQGDSLTIDFLKKQGYKITRAYPTDADWNFEKLNKADVVIIGRAIASADFAGKDSAWAAVKVPVIVMSQYAAQAKKLKMFKVDAVITDTTFVGAKKAKVVAPDDINLNNIVLANGDTIEYSTGSYTTIKFGADSFATQNNGKVLIQTNITGFSGSKAASGADAILMARWVPGVETYPGSKVIPASNWTYFGMGDDQKKIGGVTKITNFFQFTEASKQLFLNELVYLKRTTQKVMFVTSIAVKNNQTGKYADSLSVDVLTKAGYQVDKAYVTDAGWNYSVLNQYQVVIIGRGIASADFASKDSVWATIKAPVLVMSQYAAQAKKLKMFKVDAVISDTTFSGVKKAKVVAPKDIIFNGIALSTGDTMEYSTGSYTTIKFGADTFATQNNGKVIIQTNITGFSGSKAASGTDAILMARWAPGVETYSGSKVKPASTWSYFGMGDDQKKIGGVTKITNFFQFTETSKQVWLNEIAYLISTVTQIDTTPIHIPSTIATLDGIIYNEDTIDIIADVVNYAVELPVGTTVVPTVTVILTDTTATTKIVAASSLPGNTLIQVTAEDGTTKKTYKVSFTVISDDATLKSLTSGGTAIPGFSSSVVEYTVKLPAGTTAVPEVVGTSNSTKASVVVTPASALPGNTTVEVTAQDGVTKKTYTISFALISDDATLTALTSGGTDVSGFSASNVTYNIELPAGTTAVPVVVGTANNSNASVVVTPAASLPGNTTILVTAEDGNTTKTYTISFTVAVSVASLNYSIIRLYPQPASDVLCISLTEEFSNANITVFNIIGQPVLSQSLKGINPVINIGSLQAGTYFVTISKGRAVWTSKILIK
jgi:hypothetical protein